MILYSIFGILSVLTCLFCANTYPFFSLIHTFCMRNIVRTPTLSSTQWLGLTRKWLCIPHPTTTETQYQQYLSCYWPDFNETLKVGSCEHLEQIPTVDICAGNIYPVYIYTYQEYLSCCWPDFDETLKVGSWEHLEQIPTVTVTFVLATFFHIRNISAVADPCLTKLQRLGSWDHL